MPRKELNKNPTEKLSSNNEMVKVDIGGKEKLVHKKGFWKHVERLEDERINSLADDEELAIRQAKEEARLKKMNEWKPITKPKLTPEECEALLERTLNEMRGIKTGDNNG